LSFDRFDAGVLGFGDAEPLIGSFLPGISASLGSSSFAPWPNARIGFDPGCQPQTESSPTQTDNPPRTKRKVRWGAIKVEERSPVGQKRFNTDRRSDKMPEWFGCFHHIASGGAWYFL
jgi:hypothetical protein